MGNSKKEKGKKKKLKMETFPESSNEQSIPKIEIDSDNENTLSQIGNILPLSTKKGWNWKLIFERGGQ